MKRIYGNGSAHPDITITLFQLGDAAHSAGDWVSTITWYHESLEMEKRIYGTDADHLDI